MVLTNQAMKTSRKAIIGYYTVLQEIALDNLDPRPWVSASYMRDIVEF